MSKGTVTLLVIVFVVCISCGAGYAAYRIVREKLRRLSRMAFGTDSITEGLEQQAKELAVTPKSVSAMTRIFLPQIQRDFPDFHIEQFKDKVENALMLALQAISAADAGIFERQIKDGVSEEFLAQIKNRIRENETEAVTEHYEQIQIHQTEFEGCNHKFSSIERFVFQEFFLCTVECIVLWVSQERLCSKEKAAASTAGVSNRLFRFRAKTSHHCFDERAGCKILPCTTFYVLGVLLQQPFVDLALHIGGHGHPVFLVDHLHHAVQDGNIADFVDGPFEDLP